PVDFITIEKLKVESHNIEFKYILGVGRMTDNVKQFDHLIRCYAASILPKEDIKLVLLGDGKLLEQYRKLAQTLDQEENIVFLGNVANPFSFFANALFTVMTSKIEGFPMVLIESLACETPVISYDLHSGPREIIMHNENGILVENQNIVAMTNAMNTMFLSKDLYVHCKQNAKSSVERFSLETIGKQWVKLFNDLQK
ncbi:MAG TPA: glycosyltransferase family 4 protein, partial [Flavobacterium sp.]|nr:glycosyltransferase family 4 protein [Flavobacterium sp.]